MVCINLLNMYSVTNNCAYTGHKNKITVVSSLFGEGQPLYLTYSLGIVMRMQEVTQEHWFEQIPERPKKLLTLALDLFQREASLEEKLYDYSFVVFPAAKAFEGFLKHYFFTQGLITKRTYESKRFRIGRALNPDIHPKGRDEYWLYDDVSSRCGSDIAVELWDTWLTCRNQVFHFFPSKDSTLTEIEAQRKLEKVLSAIRATILCHG